LPALLPKLDYDDDMWRGPTWMNVNYLIWEGLKLYGYTDIVDQLRLRSMRATEKWYREAGVLFEYYDPADETHPYRLHRKGGVGAEDGTGFGVIRDYGWTAATYLSWAKTR